MSKQVELETLDRAIKDGQIRLCTLQSNIDVLNGKINKLCEIERQIEENVACLKKNKIVAIASEFKKVKEELVKTKRMLIVARNEREDTKKAMDNVNRMINDSREAIENIKRSGENNVVHGNFGKKDNG